MTDVNDLDFERNAGGSVSYILRFTNTTTERIEQLSAVGFEEMVALAKSIDSEPHLTEIRCVRATHLTDVTYDIKGHLNQ
jgi:hypothetical protein